MPLNDAKKLSRTAQQLIVEYKIGVGNPPSYPANWRPLWDAKVDRIEINAGARPSVATIWFPDARWDVSPIAIQWGNMIRIRTDAYYLKNCTILFVGYITNQVCEFSGGTEKPGAGFERNAVICMDQRWVLATSLIHFGQWARGPDDYKKDTDPPEAKIGSDTRLYGQRAIFNPNGRPNLDSQEEEYKKWPNFPLFCNTNDTKANYWTARDMIRFLLHPSWLAISRYCPIDDPAEILGLEVMTKMITVPDPEKPTKYVKVSEDTQNWGKVLHNIVIDGLNVIEAVTLVARHIGWNFRLDYSNNGKTYFVFYKVGIRDKAYRKDAPVIAHSLYAPKPGEKIGDAVHEGNKMLWSMSLARDITPVVNNPIALGAPHRFEFTAELVPAWFDSFLTLPDPLKPEELFYTDAELQKETDPDSLFYYKKYHLRGIIHNAGAKLRNVGRKWVLNESGFYTDPESYTPDPDNPHYDRGKAYDWKTVIPLKYIYPVDPRTGKEKRAFAPYNRRLLPCLTVTDDGMSSVGIKLEFSFDSGVTWQTIPCSVRLLDGECGIFIDEPNLAEIVDKKEGSLATGDLKDLPINLFTSLADDKLNTRIYKDRFRAEADNEPPKKPWHTRVRVTASVQMDQRIIAVGWPSSSLGSPFDQTQIYDWSDKYGLAKRTESSSFVSGWLTALEIDSQGIINAHVDSIRKNNEDMTISGRFTLDRLWLGDGEGIPTFMIGDSISSISGREYLLDHLTFGGGKVSPEIIQIIYLPDSQKQVLITRDLRYAEVLV